MRTVSFLLFDHIGGFNTLLYTLANLGTAVVPRDRSVSQVCDAIQKHRAQLLPTSPSFLNLLLLGEAHRNYDLSSLELVTYGTEVMPERTLVLLGAAIPNARLQQTYGLSELGILRSKSASNQSLLVKVGGEDYETRVVDGTLHIRARSSMLGYLNAPSPFDADGWFNTGDAVIQEGEYYRILGRRSEIINVGGQKVYPAEVETVIAELPEVIDVAVKGMQHLLLGQAVVATVQMDEPISSIEMKRRIVRHCTGRLQPYMIPTKVEVVTESQVNGRFKKVRR
jgi:acyl-coenzyme A synthetase/AMP-(fatty) acid ligase